MFGAGRRRCAGPTNQPVRTNADHRVGGEVQTAREVGSRSGRLPDVLALAEATSKGMRSSQLRTAGVDLYATRSSSYVVFPRTGLGNVRSSDSYEGGQPSKPLLNASSRSTHSD